MFANVVFINIDWKSSKMNRTLNTNMKVLATAIADVVHNMSPAMICICEMGETTHPLSEEQLQRVATQSISAWKDTATEHIQLRSMFTKRAPYVTILHRWSNPMLGPSDSAWPVLCKRTSSHSTSICVLSSWW